MCLEMVQTQIKSATMKNKANTPNTQDFFFFLAALGLHCCIWAFSSCSEWGLLFIEVHGLLIAVASLVAEHGLWARRLQ